LNRFKNFDAKVSARGKGFECTGNTYPLNDMGMLQIIRGIGGLVKAIFADLIQCLSVITYAENGISPNIAIVLLVF
jgi:hypothetical protein